MKNAGKWFVPKIFGLGWRPITWQGWLVILIFVVLIVLSVLNSQGYKRLMIIFALIIILSVICYLKGGKPGSELFK